MTESIPLYKVIVLGDSGVGKTSLCHVCKFNVFPENVEVTIGFDVWEKSVQLHDCPEGNIRLQLWDTAGQERFRFSITGKYYRGTHGALFIYDITNADSFESLINWERELDKQTLGTVKPMKFLVGTKTDLELQRKVPRTRAEHFAKEHSMHFFELSAKKDVEEIDRAFAYSAQKLYNTFEHNMIETPDYNISVEDTGNVRKRNCIC
ncbi:Ras-related protein Rab-33B-like [Oopsacas minuta]|uniref:Ras-related protein Rab-33B-like n=1 Tax=Oopsacas minuta TaxID=111878 RepID=A0AAV7JHZ1_9METZ|nr:Ras-related protein Rab-33B-like [Oopsacas minuta]